MSNQFDQPSEQQEDRDFNSWYKPDVSTFTSNDNGHQCNANASVQTNSDDKPLSESIREKTFLLGSGKFDIVKSESNAALVPDIAPSHLDFGRTAEMTSVVCGLDTLSSDTILNMASTSKTTVIDANVDGESLEACGCILSVNVLYNNIIDLEIANIVPAVSSKIAHPTTEILLQTCITTFQQSVSDVGLHSCAPIFSLQSTVVWGEPTTSDVHSNYVETHICPVVSDVSQVFNVARKLCLFSSSTADAQSSFSVNLVEPTVTTSFTCLVSAEISSPSQPIIFQDVHHLSSSNEDSNNLLADQLPPALDSRHAAVLGKSDMDTDVSDVEHDAKPCVNSLFPTTDTRIEPSTSIVICPKDTAPMVKTQHSSNKPRGLLAVEGGTISATNVTTEVSTSNGAKSTDLATTVYITPRIDVQSIISKIKQSVRSHDEDILSTNCEKQMPVAYHTRAVRNSDSEGTIPQSETRKLISYAHSFDSDQEDDLETTAGRKNDNLETKAGRKNDHETKVGRKNDHETKVGRKNDHETKAGRKNNDLETKAGRKNDDLETTAGRNNGKHCRIPFHATEEKNGFAARNRIAQPKNNLGGFNLKHLESGSCASAVTYPAGFDNVNRKLINHSNDLCTHLDRSSASDTGVHTRIRKCSSVPFATASNKLQLSDSGSCRSYSNINESLNHNIPLSQSVPVTSNVKVSRGTGVVSSISPLSDISSQQANHLITLAKKVDANDISFSDALNAFMYSQKNADCAPTSKSRLSDRLGRKVNTSVDRKLGLFDIPAALQRQNLQEHEMRVKPGHSLPGTEVSVFKGRHIFAFINLLMQRSSFPSAIICC